MAHNVQCVCEGAEAAAAARGRGQVRHDVQDQAVTKRQPRVLARRVRHEVATISHDAGNIAPVAGGGDQAGGGPVLEKIADCKLVKYLRHADFSSSPRPGAYFL